MRRGFTHRAWHGGASSETWKSLVFWLRQLARELCAGADVQLAVDGGQCGFNRVHRDDECRCDLLVRLSFSDELGDALLAPRQAASRWSPTGDATELRPRSRGPELGAERFEDVERVLERLPGGPPLPRAALGRTERQQRAAAFEGDRSELVVVEGPSKRRRGSFRVPLLGSRQPAYSRRDGDCTRTRKRLAERIEVGRESLRFRALPDSDERLAEVAKVAILPGVDDARRPACLGQRHEAFARAFVVADAEVEQSERPLADAEADTRAGRFCEE